ncbi:MAG TPA: methyltransferase domain-containing protein [Alphaproteobacteria bacterium]|nr:methyltransferase domain-containing protein [Alphaproteobacteria bacterium]
MPINVAIDEGREFDWGRTSGDYAQHRPGPPLSFFERLRVLGVGLPRQRILDLATGTGVLARQFARQGANVTGIDIAPEQIEAASSLADGERLEARFAVASAEQSGLPDSSFDVITANQCWLYFDRDRILLEIDRLLAADGVLVVSFFNWLPGLDPIARASEELVLKFNPQWQGANWDGRIPPMPSWAKDRFELTAMFWYDEPIPFTRESWRGRMRACRGTGASLDGEALAAFDRAHDALLREIAGEQFSIIHRINAHFLRPIRTTSWPYSTSERLCLP